MNENQLLKVAKRYLDKGLNKNFYLHTLGVLKAAKAILGSGIGDAEIVIPAAILHDTGWSQVPKELQGNTSPEDIRRGMEMHLVKGAEIAEHELQGLGYDNKTIIEISEAIKSHKYSESSVVNNKVLIDADNLSDIYPEQFESDIISYNTTAKKLIKYRSQNTFYFDISKKMFAEELEKRKSEHNKKA